MLGYHLFIAWKSIRRTPKHSLLIIAGIALGVAVATLFSTIHHTYARDPIPEKSGQLYYVRMDNWDPHEPYSAGSPPPQITYQDMIGIMKSDIPVRQTASFQSNLRISAGTRRPRLDFARICHAGFFAMFGLPFRFGSAWDREADEKASPVVVIDDELNQRFFDGEDSVGRTVRIDERDFRVVGVLAPFRPSIKYYDLTGSSTLPPERMFISISHVRSMQIATAGMRQRWGEWKAPGFEGRFVSEFNFLQMWVELAGPAEVLAYKSYLDAYTMEQRRLGRFQRPLDNRLTPLLEYMRERNCPPPEATAVMITANLFLAACALSLMGSLLSRFLSREAELSVRRALGASRWDIFAQHIIECEVVAFIGGMLGLGAAASSLWLVNLWFKTMSLAYRDDVFRMDLPMAGFAVAVSLAAGLIAGAYPAYRVCRFAPAAHLKVQ